MTSLVQYVVVRGDLLRNLKWPTGAVIAQACHACTAIIHHFYGDPNVMQYLSDVDNMHKVVLEVKDEDELRNISEKLSAQNRDYKLWIEQPENYATCLAVKPYPKDEIKPYLKGLKLYK
ncbi:putative peptidyl-tRNA hydrolase PTRHD1 [Anneissia japonica]|uniref:putative peptidyl-tRNA hydrolase PTRHD1 n=1 Tax=Anneissia japonica TaxID=1529436 RepID=UPI00142553BB|nr:putative peptidyl-tRNA hydrolase PTRHD1 [Anneissia japonica]